MCSPFMTRPFLGDDIPLDEVELLDILGATGEISWVLSSTVGTFWGGSLAVWGNLS